MMNIRLMRGRDIVKELQMDESDLVHPVYEEPISIVLKRGDDVVKTITNVREKEHYIPRKYTNKVVNNKPYTKQQDFKKKDTVVETKVVKENKNDTSKSDVNSNINITTDEYYGIKNNFMPKPKEEKPEVKKDVKDIPKNDKVVTSTKKTKTTIVNKEIPKQDKYEKALGVKPKTEPKVEGTQTVIKETITSLKSDTNNMMQKYLDEYDDVEYDNFEKINKSKNLDLY